MEAVINTLQASTLTLIFARVFGKKHKIDCLQGMVTVYKWRGKDYLFDYRRGLTL